MAYVDVYGRTHELETQFLDAIATRLESRRSSKHYISMLHEYLDAIDLSKVDDALALDVVMGRCLTRGGW